MPTTSLLIAVAETDTFWPHKFMDSWLELIAALGAAIAFGLGLWRYTRAQTWKRTQFLAQEVFKFRSHPPVSKAIAMLDNYKSRDIDLFEKESDPKRRMVSVTTELVCMAFLEKDKYDTEEARRCDAIRDAFDAFFDGLERFECYIAARLVTEDEIRPFLVYWLEQFADPEASCKGEKFVEAACHYIRQYYFDEVERLCKRFGFDVKRAEKSSKPATKN